MNIQQAPTLRYYQEDFVHNIRREYAKGAKAVLGVLPTGGGKTFCFSWIAHNAVARGKRVLINVHRDELMRQSAESLRMFGLRVGLISPKYTPDLHAPVQVGMVQTLVNRTPLYPHFDLIITDECHHSVASTYAKIYSAYPDAYHLGVTATPVRSDGLGLGRPAGGIYDTMVIGPTIRQLIDEGFLVEPTIYGCPNKLDLSGVGNSGGDYNRKQLAALMERSSITGDVVAHYSKICPGEPGVMFCVNVKHAEETARQFRQAGFRAYSVDGKMDIETRRAILAGLGTGQVQVVASCDIISEGTDIPAIACAGLLRPTQSESLYLQQIGRALRTCEGKERAIVFDHVGNVIRHGLPDEDRQWTLEGEKRKRRKKKDEEKAPLVYQCKKCYAAFRPTLPECPQCGTAREFQGREIKQVEGELQELTATDKAAIAKMRRAEVAKARTLEELQAVARARGYKPGWARHVYNSRKNRR